MLFRCRATELRAIAMTLEIGERVGEYLLEERLQRVGALTTYLASKDSQPVVVKTFDLEATEEWKSVELFERSVETLSELDIPGVPEFIEYIEDDDRNLRILIREFVDGETLAERLDVGWHPTDDRLREIARDGLRILEDLHGRNPPIVHRDVKPANIVLGEDGAMSLIDFGVVRTTLHSEATHPGTVVGTYGYMAPEQFRGHAVPSTDLYGLGATILRIATGRPPADLPYEKLRVKFRDHADVPDDFADWLDRMVAPAIEDRFESARRARRALEVNEFDDTLEIDEPSDVEIADTVPSRSESALQIRDARDRQSSLSADVTAGQLLADAPEGTRITVRARRHCVEFALPRIGMLSMRGFLAGAISTVAAGFIAGLIAIAFHAEILLPVLFVIPVVAVVANSLYEVGTGEIVQIGKGFLQVKRKLFGWRYASLIRTEIRTVEVDDANFGTVHGAKLRLWSGVDDALDVGRHLSPPELDWIEAVFEFALDHPEAVRRSKMYENQLDSSPASR